ncbi:MAG: dioxygenase [Calditrichales bacterium]|nr:MAG: dioxygenase [Calditrichales bacterium]
MNSNFNRMAGSVLYISHGGGPLPLLGDEDHNEMIKQLTNVTALIKRPSAIIVISAHWEEEIPTITSGKNPSLIYDYYGFPPEAYTIEYPTKGAPLLANKIFELLKNNNIEAKLDDRRGFDHGVFVPLKIMYPEADIPCVQLSLVKGLKPLTHIQIGQALTALLEENVLIIGSGFSFHNLRAFFAPTTKESQNMNASFEKWLIDTCSNHRFNKKEREQRLINWEQAPAARYCHPREEHLIPLHVCYGIVNAPAEQVFKFEIIKKKASAYLWRNNF